MRWLLTNGKFQGNDAGELAAEDGFALVPMQFVRGWDDALVIGLGTGRTTFVVTTMGFERVTVAEISPAIVEAARAQFAHVNGGVLERPQTRIAIEDGRTLLLLEDHQYDVVTMEISSVWFAGSTNLYSREFYEIAHARLKPGGVLQQWIQFHHIAEEDLLTAIATLRAVFRHVAVYVTGGQGILVGSDDPQVTTAEYVERFDARARTLGRRSAVLLAASRLLSPADVDALVAGGHPTLNTDRNRRLEWTTPRYALEKRDMRRENVLAIAAASRLSPPEVAPDASGKTADALRAIDAATIRRALQLE
jgi:spermidine synthase